MFRELRKIQEGLWPSRKARAVRRGSQEVQMAFEDDQKPSRHDSRNTKNEDQKA